MEKTGIFKRFTHILDHFKKIDTKVNRDSDAEIIPPKIEPVIDTAVTAPINDEVTVADDLSRYVKNTKGTWVDRTTGKFVKKEIAEANINMKM